MRRREFGRSHLPTKIMKSPSMLVEHNGKQLVTISQELESSRQVAWWPQRLE